MMFEPWRPPELISLDPRYSKMVPHERWPDIRKSVFALYQIKLKDGHTGLSLMLTQVESVSLKPIILFLISPFLSSMGSSLYLLASSMVMGVASRS